MERIAKHKKIICIY